MNDARERFSKLLEAGASAFDEPSVRYVATLLERAEASEAEAVSARLLARVVERLDRMEAEMAEARAKARAVLSDLEPVDADSAFEVSELVASGRFREASRLGRARLRSYDPEAPGRLLSRISALEARALAHGIRLPAELRGRVERLRGAGPLGTAAIRSGTWLAEELSVALLREVLSRSRGWLGIRRIARREHLPEQIGPYNPRAVATRALDKMARLSPEYLRVWFDTLSDLAALSKLSPPPPPATKKKKR